MKTEEKPYSRQWFAEKLTLYIEIRHPDIIRVKRLVAGRSRTAYGVFRRALGGGHNLPTALGEADRILYHGLIFSRFDTVWMVLENEFPHLIDRDLRNIALKLLPVCDDVFNRYKPDDEFYSTAQSRKLYNEINERINETLKINGLQED